MNGDRGLAAVLRAARHDGLTGCLNYVGVLEALKDEVKRCERHGGSFSCCLLDLDHFKQINDRAGHMHGNKVLAAVGEALRAGVRGFDSVGRFGGDEFLVVLPRTGPLQARELAERIRASAEQALREIDEDRVNASGGVASWSPELTGEVLLHRADRALAAAKVAGGATIVQDSDSLALSGMPA
jgi:diguanylate cyclase (GGDEF)-like protein